MFKEFRRYPRYPISTKALITIRDNSTQQRLTTQVITISQAGMGVYSDVNIKKATEVSIQLMFHTHDGTTKENIFEGKIASICPHEKDYFVGIAFNSNIPYERFIEIIN